MVKGISFQFSSGSVFMESTLKKQNKTKTCSYFSMWPSVLGINHSGFKLITSFWKQKERQESGIAGNPQSEMVQRWLQDKLAWSLWEKKMYKIGATCIFPFIHDNFKKFPSNTG